MNAFGANCYSEVNGTLSIGISLGDASSGIVSDVTDLSPLSSIRIINGYLRIENNANLTSLNGLQLLEINSAGLNADGLSIEPSGILIGNNDLLTNFNGLESLQSINGELYAFHNDNLKDLVGLTNLTSVSNVLLTANDEMTSLDGMPNITNMNTFHAGTFIFDITIPGNDNLTDFCGIEYIIQNISDLDFFAFLNAYNPTKQDILNGLCLQP